MVRLLGVLAPSLTPQLTVSVCLHAKTGAML